VKGKILAAMLTIALVMSAMAGAVQASNGPTLDEVKAAVAD
jgi:hypothetical protein